MNAPCQIDILRVHKEPLVEQPRFQQCLRAQQHKTAGQIGRIDRLGVIQLPQFEACVACAGFDMPAEHHTADKIHRRGQQFAHVLLPPLTVHHAGQQLPYQRVSLHDCQQIVNRLGSDLYIGVDHQVVGQIVVDRLAYSLVVRSTVTEVLTRSHHLHAFRRLIGSSSQRSHQLRADRFRRVVHQIDPVHTGRAQQLLHQRLPLLSRRVVQHNRYVQQVGH